MRYESFYPFASNQSPPVAMRQYPQYDIQQQQIFGPPSRQFQGPPTGNQFVASSQDPTQNNSKMEMYMQTANRFLNTAQQFAPLVQQVAPMVQNLPAMWRLYKGFQSLPSAGAAPTGGAPSPIAPTGSGLGSQSAPIGGSNPRIFQPPNF